jgi:hypothetical protein
MVPDCKTLQSEARVGMSCKLQMCVTIRLGCTRRWSRVRPNPLAGSSHSTLERSEAVRLGVDIDHLAATLSMSMEQFQQPSFMLLECCLPLLRTSYVPIKQGLVIVTSCKARGSLVVTGVIGARVCL